MPLRRRSRRAPGGPAEAFRPSAEHVQRAKEAITAAVPSPRGVPGVPLAEAIAGFEASLGRALGAMEMWRGLEDDLWRRCRLALDEAMSRAERLRQEAPALDYEGLVAVLGGLLDPLDAFEEAERALTARSRRAPPPASAS